MKKNRMKNSARFVVIYQNRFRWKDSQIGWTKKDPAKETKV